MWKINQPPYTTSEVFDQCISRARPATKTKLSAERDAVISAAKLYQEAAESQAVHQLEVPKFNKDSDLPRLLKGNYTTRMVPGDSPGRRIYETIKGAVSICPMCGHRPVFSLDHVMPKDSFPHLSVVPNNLVPCCGDCNHAKSDALPTSATDVYINPYFDDVDKYPWLVATIIEESPAAAIYRVKPPENWDAVLSQRVIHHFKTLGLANLYTAQAGVEIPALEIVLEREFCRAGATGVRQSLNDHRSGRLLSRNNSWQAALFQALAESNWYCNGGFRS